MRHSRFLVSRRWASLVLGLCLVAATLTVATVELNQHPGGALADNGLTGAVMGDACPSPSSHEVKTLMGTGPGTSHQIVARVMVVGDSTACTMLPGLEAVAAPAGVEIENAAVVGCGVVSGEIAPDDTNGVNVNGSPRSAAPRRPPSSGAPFGLDLRMSFCGEVRGSAKAWSSDTAPSGRSSIPARLSGTRY